jgi:hypothetical protein
MNVSSAAWKVLIEDSFDPILSRDGSISAAKRIFAVKDSSRQSKLLKALANGHRGVLRREDLLAAMYDEFFKDNPSLAMRRTETRYRTAVKTVSRIRIALENFFGDLSPPGFNWLPWNEKLGGWILFQRAAVDQSMAI